METYKPTTRKSQLLVQELPDEVLVYDVERNEVHCLNGTAARVWALCDGEHTVSEIAKQLGTDLSPSDAEALVWCALDQFTEKQLLEDNSESPVASHRPADMTRRQMVLRIGLVVGLLPVVDSILSPPAALAASPHLGHTPTTGPTPP